MKFIGAKCFFTGTLSQAEKFVKKIAPLSVLDPLCKHKNCRGEPIYQDIGWFKCQEHLDKRTEYRYVALFERYAGQPHSKKNPEGQLVMSCTGDYIDDKINIDVRDTKVR